MVRLKKEFLLSIYIGKVRKILDELTFLWTCTAELR